MSAEPQATTPASDADSERFVKIPHALPGQEYRAPRNFANPPLLLLWQVAVVVLSLSLPLAPAVIFYVILSMSKAIEMGFLWIWIPMIIFIETIAIGVAVGVIREALGRSGVSYSR